MKLLGSVSLIGAAFAVALLTSGLTGSCGGFAECGSDSNVVIAAIFSWLGLAGVVAAVVLALRGSSRAVVVFATLTVIAYSGWLVTLIREYGG
jgi:hypothetical protein